MDNQPTQPGDVSPEMPINPNPIQSDAPVANEAPTPPTGLPATGDVILEAGKKKRKKGLIITLVCIIAVLLIGGGAFAAAYIINNQPANILMSALNNFVSADQMGVDGTIEFTTEGTEEFGLKSINVNFQDKNIGFSNSATATINIGFTDGSSAPAVELGEVLMSNGVLYIEVNGAKNFYDKAYRDNLKETLMNQALYGNNTITDCSTIDGDAEVDCLKQEVAVDASTKEAISKAIDDILDQVGEIIGSIDGQWIEINIESVLNDDMLSNIPSGTRQTISDGYKCATGVFSQMSNYSNEFSDLYSQNSFISMTAGSDSFYNISFDSSKLAGYLNGVSKTKFASDLANCFNTTVPDTTSNVTTENIDSLLEYMPQISAKFDGIFDHHLTELKVTKQSDNYSLNTDLKFSYPKDTTIYAPASSRPVMEVVKEVYQGLETIFKDVYSL